MADNEYFIFDSGSEHISIADYVSNETRGFHSGHIKRVNNDFFTDAPSFDEFSIPVISWNVFMGNDIKSEDHMSITFAAMPMYSAPGSSSWSKLERGMELLINVSNTDKRLLISVLLKELTYSLKGGTTSCTLLMSTRKIWFDTYPDKYQLAAQSGDQELSLRDFVGGWADRLMINFTETLYDETASNINVKKFIDGRQNILDVFEEIIQPKGSQPIVSLWIDIFNNLNIFPVHEGKGVYVINYNEPRFKNNIMSVDYRMFNSFEERDVSTDSNIGNPSLDNSKKDSVTQCKTNLEGDPVCRDKKRKKGTRVYAEGSGGLEITNSIKKYFIPDQTLTIAFKGACWFKAHYRVSLNGFVIGNADDYIIKSVTISDNIIDMSTVLVLERSTEFNQPEMDAPIINKPGNGDGKTRFKTPLEGKITSKTIKEEK